MVKDTPSNTGDVVWSLVGAKIPYAVGQLSPRATAGKPPCCKEDLAQPKLKKKKKKKERKEKIYIKDYQIFSIKDQSVNVLGFVEPYSLCHNDSPLPLCYHSERVSKWVWLCSYSTLFTKTCCRPSLSPVLFVTVSTPGLNQTPVLLLLIHSSANQCMIFPWLKGFLRNGVSQLETQDFCFQLLWVLYPVSAMCEWESYVCCQ